MNNPNKKTSVLIFVFIAALHISARTYAAQIQGVTVNAVSTQFANLATSTPERCPATNVVGSSGFFGDNHTFIRGGTMWLTASNIVNNSGVTPFITFDLGAVQTLSAMKVWNYNGHVSSSPVSAASTNLGVQLANISYSTDNVTFTTNLSNYTFNIAPGTFTNFAQNIPMGGVAARYVRIDIITNWATVNAQVGLSKVRFIDDTVPPTVLSASENYSSNQVTVMFSEPVDPVSGTNTANYVVQSGTNTATILSAAMGEFDDRIILKTSPLTNLNYTLTASSIFDQAHVIAITNNSIVPITPEVILWLKADAGVLTDGSGNVTNWLDQSGYGHNAGPATNPVGLVPISAPVLTPSFVNGQPALFFGGNNSLEVPGTPDLSINGDMTVIIVVDKTTSALGDPISRTGSQSSLTFSNNMPAPFDIQLANSTSKAVFVWGNPAEGAPTTLSANGGLALNSFYIVSYVVQGTNVSLYLNGSFNGASALPYVAGDDGKPLRLGLRLDNGAKFTGYTAEAMIIRGTVTPTDLVSIHQYLGPKYGIPIASLAITEQPQNVTAQVGKTATFWVNAVGVPPLSYQWKSNNISISGATSAVYTTPKLNASFNGASYTATVTTPVGSTNTTGATLTVVNDTTAPTVFSAAKTTSGTNVVVVFSEPVDAATGLTASNYSLNNGVSILSASYGSAASNSIVLTTSTLDTNAGYFVSVQNVQDLFGNTIVGITVPVLPANLSIYLRGDSGVVLDTANLLVDQWVDQTTNGNSAVQYLGGQDARPATGDTINGVPVLRFNNNYLQAASSPTLAITGDLSIYAVVNFSDYSVAREILGKALVNQPASYDYYVSSATDFRLYRGNGSVSAVARATAAPTTGVPHVISVTMQGTNASHFLDGNPNGTAGASTTQGDGGTPLVIGSRNDLSQFMLGDMAEVMVFKASLSAGDRIAIDNFLGIKYFPFSITPPASVSTNQGVTATFTVAASQGSAHFLYQWRENAANLPGATNIAYTTPVLAPSDNGETFDVIVTIPGLSTNTSAAATLTVNNVPPTVVSAGASIWSQTQIVVVFSEAVLPATATNIGNYSLDNGASVLSAAIGDAPNKVVLTTSPLTPGTPYSLTVQNVMDLFGNTIVTIIVPSGVYPAATALWIRADTGVTTDANGVTQWNDLSGNGNNFIQGFGPYEPQLVTNAVNGLPVIRFTATNETFMGVNTSPSLQITGDMAIFAVMNFNSLSGNTNGMIVSKTSLSQPAPYDYYVRPTTVQFYRGNGTISGFANSTRAPSLGVPHLLDVVMQGNTVTQSLDGVTNGSGTVAVAIADTAQSLYIGTRADGFNRLNGDMAELIIIGSALSAGDRATLENYLAVKYSIQLGAAPTLTLVDSGTNVVLSWATPTANFVLNSTPTLSPGAWAPVTNAVVNSGGVSTVTIPVGGSQTFYRLQTH